MTVVEQNREFLAKIKSLDREDIKDPSSYDVIFALNQGQDSIIDELLANNNIGALRPITESVVTASPFDDASYVSGINGAHIVDLTSLSTSVMAYRNYVRSQSEMYRSNAPEILVGAKVYVQNEEIPKEIRGDFETNGTNVPIFTQPKCFLEGNYLIVLADGYTTTTNVQVTVIRQPKALSLATDDTTNVTTCELPAEFHKMIVDRAVRIYSETVNVNDVKR